jgi:hypothetical protein
MRDMKQEQHKFTPDILELRREKSELKRDPNVMHRQHAQLKVGECMSVCMCVCRVCVCECVCVCRCVSVCM